MAASQPSCLMRLEVARQAQTSRLNQCRPRAPATALGLLGCAILALLLPPSYIQLFATDHLHDAAESRRRAILQGHSQKALGQFQHHPGTQGPSLELMLKSSKYVYAPVDVPAQRNPQGKHGPYDNGAAVVEYIRSPGGKRGEVARSRHRNKRRSRAAGGDEAKDIQTALCSQPAAPRVHSIHRVGGLTRESRESALKQHSVSIDHVTHRVRSPAEAVESHVTWYSDTGPTCDLSKCDQTKFPFIYLLIALRGRVHNVERLIGSLKTATERCNRPAWLPCLCFLVSDFATDDTEDTIDALNGVWDGHVRVIQKRHSLDPWVKAQALVFGQHSIPTEQTRSLVFHIDADIYVMSDTFIDVGLNYTAKGKWSQ